MASITNDICKLCMFLELYLLKISSYAITTTACDIDNYNYHAI